MKTTQYIRQEKAIAAADTNGIRERWLWGLRLLRDAEVFTSGGQMKAGRADELIAALKSAGRKISQREIQYRLKAARTYPTDSQIAQISARFENWSALIAADFPTVDALPDELPADHRTDTERQRDHARALTEILGEQGTLFPLADFEPHETPLKDLKAYADEMAELTARFRRRDEERQAYLTQLIDAADGDMSTTWQDAHMRAFGERIAEAA
jgi:hypothetical protein